MAYAQIIVKLYRKEQDRIYTYEIPQGMCLSVGMMVQVPFGGGNRLIEGFVLETTETTAYPPEKTKPVARVIGQEPVFGERFRWPVGCSGGITLRCQPVWRCLFPGIRNGWWRRKDVQSCCGP